MIVRISIPVIAAFLLPLFLTACSSVKVEQYADRQPALSLMQFFNGELTAHGIVKDRKGRVTRTFNVIMRGSWDENGHGMLEEDFIWSDGEKQQRTWYFTPDDTGQYWARADDVKQPVPVNIAGNALFMKYQLQVNVKGRSLWLSVDDRMYLVDEDILMNESTLKKFGFRVGHVTLTMVRH